MSAPQAPPKKQQELQLQYQNYKNTLQQISQKIGDIEQEAEEHKSVSSNSLSSSLRLPVVPSRSPSLHERLRVDSPLISPNRLVLETLEPLQGDRKCFRMINGVLVERTVKDVIPALKTNAEGLKKVLEDLVKQYALKQDELEKWKKKNNVQVVQSV